MKRAILTLFAVSIVGCASIPPDGRLTPYHAQLENLRIDYALPNGARLLGAPPDPTIEFPTHRPYPLTGGIAAVGWEFYRDIPQVQLDLVLEKVSMPRFGRAVVPTDWEAILRLERVSTMPYSRVRIIQDAKGVEWQETTVEVGGKIEARSFLRPIAPDILILLRLNLGDRLADHQRAEAITIQEKMLAGIGVTDSENRSP